MQRRNSGFTLLELMTVILIISILTVVFAQAVGDFRARADFSRCMTNIRSLYVAAGGYVQEQGHWPQIDPLLNNGGSTQFADQWYDALKKYGISRQGWLCPTVQRQLNSPDMDVSSNHRADYMATPFDDKPRTPYRWATQPWFIEKSSSHPGGNLLIFSDGQAMNLKESLKRRYQAP